MTSDKDAFVSRILDPTGFDKHVSTLTESQKQFIDLLKDWFYNPRHLLLIVSGGPGAGKTYTVVKTLEYLKIELIKMAPTAKVAKNIGGRTIHSTMRLPWGPGSILRQVEKECMHYQDDDEYVKKCIKKSSKLKFTCDLVEMIVLDEVGMLPFWLTYQIIKFFFRNEKPVLFIAMGDSWQLRPVKSAYNVFQVQYPDIETRFVEMIESKRFVPEYLQIIDTMRRLNDIDSMIDYVQKTFPVVEGIYAEMLERCSRALVYTNSTVEAYNKFYLDRLPGKCIRLYKIKDDKIYRDHYVDVKKNCMVIVTENNCGTAMNGTCLTFVSYNSELDRVECHDEFGKLVYVTRSEYTGVIPITVGFASTIHKFQGETIDDAKILFNFDGCQDVHLIYTALSRVRCMDQILAVKL